MTASTVSAAPEGTILERSLVVPSMGGTLRLLVGHAPGQEAAADAALTGCAARVERWAARLTRYTTTSDLAALNADPSRARTPVRPTLGAVLGWAERAVHAADGLLDVTMLDERLAAQGLLPAAPAVETRTDRWWLERGTRSSVVHRRGTFRFDLDGVAKGWIADRALELLRAWPAALVDADGDIALRPGPIGAWMIGVADPRPDTDHDLAMLRLSGDGPAGRIAVATSGTSVHRWVDGPDGAPRHHLIDPRTRRPARTDVIQVTVIGRTAREAEVLAKTALIAGSHAGLDRLEDSAALGAILLLTSGETIALPRTLELLA
ncbi:MAG: FAD:protein FMN transferase [Chloroflexota bacterium]